VGGRGEDEERFILSVGDQEGLARREVWVEGGSLELPDELVFAGNQCLAKNEIKQTMTCTAQRHGAFQYGRDYDLGDRMTLESRMGRLDARLIEAIESYERDGPPGVRLVFGEAPVTMTSVVRGMQNNRVR
jgi:hypothetical protein